MDAAGAVEDIQCGALPLIGDAIDHPYVSEARAVNAGPNLSRNRRLKPEQV
jgi:hypothetical protein